MKHLNLFIFSIICTHVLFICFGLVLVYFNNPSAFDPAHVGVLLAVGGLIYTPLFALSNLTQFLVIKHPHKKVLAYFAPVFLITLCYLVGILFDLLDPFLWKIMIPAQLVVSLFAHWYFKRELAKGNPAI